MVDLVVDINTQWFWGRRLEEAPTEFGKLLRGLRLMAECLHADRHLSGQEGSSS
jgi:hypothetical protein